MWWNSVYVNIHSCATSQCAADPTPEWGSIVCAYVAPVSPTNAPTLEALRHHVKETLAAYYAPRELVVVDSIPRTALGKVITAELPQ